MPTKINLTRNDELAFIFHEVAQKPIGAMTSQDIICKAQAVLISSFSSAHSWQTYRCLVENNTERLRSPSVKEEYFQAEAWKWKKVRSVDISEVAQAEINDSLFSMWLTFNTIKDKKILYRDAWNGLKTAFNNECDGRQDMVSRASYKM